MCYRSQRDRAGPCAGMTGSWRYCALLRITQQGPEQIGTPHFAGDAETGHPLFARQRVVFTASRVGRSAQSGVCRDHLGCAERSRQSTTLQLVMRRVSARKTAADPRSQARGKRSRRTESWSSDASTPPSPMSDWQGWYGASLPVMRHSSPNAGALTGASGVDGRNVAISHEQ